MYTINRQLKNLIAARNTLLNSVNQEGGHCAFCDEYTHGDMCIYCFTDETKVRKELNFLESKIKECKADERYRPLYMANLTQHQLTADQLSSFPGAVIIENNDKSVFLNFSEVPTSEDIQDRATGLAKLATGATHALVGGAPYLMGPLEEQLRQVGIIPIYAFSERVSEEVISPDGEVTKINKFKHAGWVGDDNLNIPEIKSTVPVETCDHCLDDLPIDHVCQ